MCGGIDVNNAGANAQAANAQDAAKSLIEQIDTDGSGDISKDEIAQLFNKMLNGGGQQSGQAGGAQQAGQKGAQQAGQKGAQQAGQNGAQQNGQDGDQQAGQNGKAAGKSAADPKQQLDQLDTDKSGKINAAEFQKASPELQNAVEELGGFQQVAGADNQIDIGELQALMNNGATMKNLDTDNNGKLSAEEVKADSGLQKQVDDLGGFEKVAGIDQQVDSNELAMVLNQASGRAANGVGTEGKKPGQPDLSKLLDATSRLLNSMVEGDSQGMQNAINDLQNLVGADNNNANMNNNVGNNVNSNAYAGAATTVAPASANPLFA